MVYKIILQQRAQLQDKETDGFNQVILILHGMPVGVILGGSNPAGMFLSYFFISDDIGFFWSQVWIPLLMCNEYNGF